MINRPKKLAAYLLTFIFVANVFVTNMVFASDNTDTDIVLLAKSFLEVAFETPEDYNLKDRCDSYTLSKEITPYEKDEKGKLRKLDNIKYYFIMSDKEAIATLVVNSEPYSVVFETDTAKKYNEYGAKEFTIICTDNEVKLAKTKWNTKMQNEQKIEFRKAETVTLQAPILSRNSFPAGYGLSIPIKSQGSNNLCWAASIASAYEYLEGVSKSAWQIADAAGIPYDEGADITLIEPTLEDVCGLESIRANGIYSLEIIYMCLSNDRIPLAFFGANLEDENVNNNLGHVVVIQGFSASTQGAVLRIMDPNYDSYVMIFNGTTPTSNFSTWTFSYGSDVYYWYDTICCW